MKKLFLVLALAGMTASISAIATPATSKAGIVILKGDPKKKKDKKSCCAADSTKTDAGCKGEKKGGCCKDKSKTAETPKN